MKKIFLSVFFVLAFVSLVYAGEKSKIELTDGSTLGGEIVSFSEGKYTVMSPSLGVLRIEDSKVRAIHREGPAAGVPPKAKGSFDAAQIQSQVQKIQAVIASGPDIMKAISKLISDPDFQALLKDPELLKAARSMDMKALMANEKVVNLFSHPTLTELSQKVKEQNG